MSLKDAITKELATKGPQNAHHTKKEGKGRPKYQPDRTKTLEELIIVSTLDKLFYLRDNEDEERAGLHASSIIKSDNEFCYREQVLSLLFKQKQGQQLPVPLLRIFAAGTSIHEKWQNLFVKAGIAVEIENRYFSEQYEMYFTPDGIIRISDRKYPVEIKSMNTFAYSKASSHPQGQKQLQLYMHMLGIDKGFVLCEDKNNQEWKPIIINYDYREVYPLLERLHEVQEMKKEFLKSGELPSKRCKNQEAHKAKNCKMCDACFAIFNGREPL